MESAMDCYSADKTLYRSISQPTKPKTHLIVLEASRNQICLVHNDPDLDYDVKQDAEEIDVSAASWDM